MTCSKSLKIVTTPNFLPVNQANTTFLRPMLGNGKKPENKYYMKFQHKTFFVNVKEA